LYAVLLKWLTGDSCKESNNMHGKPDRISEAENRVEPKKAESEAAMERLSMLTGLDITRGLAILPGNTEKFLKLLHRFVETTLDEMMQLEASFAEADLVTAQSLAHNLKGSASLLGAHLLAAIGGRLENKLRTSRLKGKDCEDIHIEMELISQELITLATALRPLPIVQF